MSDSDTKASDRPKLKTKVPDPEWEYGFDPTIDHEAHPELCTDEIEISPEMLAAGCSALALFDKGDMAWDRAFAVYDAMERQRRVMAASKKPDPR
jgi:hypothetical protein